MVARLLAHALCFGVVDSPTRSLHQLYASGHRLVLKTWYCCLRVWQLLPTPDSDSGHAIVTPEVLLGCCSLLLCGVLRHMAP